MNKRKRRNFTLIELMVVMLLMGLIMTLMLPSFNRMIRGNKVDQLASRPETRHGAGAVSRGYQQKICRDGAAQQNERVERFRYGGKCGSPVLFRRISLGVCRAGGGKGEQSLEVCALGAESGLEKYAGRAPCWSGFMRKTRIPTITAFSKPARESRRRSPIRKPMISATGSAS